MLNGDIVIFYAKGRLVMTGEVYLKKQSPNLALAMWPPDDNGNPWQYTFFIKNLKYISIPITVFNAAVGYKYNNIVQGFTYLGSEKIERIINQYGSVEKLLGIFTDENSEEAPGKIDKLYVNIPRSVTPVIHDAPRLVPVIRYEKTSSKKPKKIDYLARNKNNSITGSKGEELVLNIERKKLMQANKNDLAKKVRRVSTEDDTLGYDILSYDADGKERYIEVKSSSSINKFMRFYVSSNEYAIGKTKNNYFIYFVEDVNSDSPQVTVINNPMDESKFLIKPDGYIFEAENK